MQDKHSGKHVDEITGVETTGHVWDGIRELNNPLPRWWLWTFYLTIIWAVIYAILYPSIPLISGNTKGLLGYSSRAEVAQEMSVAKGAQSEYLQQIADLPIGDIAANQELLQFALAGGSAAFKVNCVQCHGSGAQGSAGYPNLNDDDWLWGGSTEAIYETLLHGIRFDQDDDTRVSEMPAFADVLEPDQIKQVAAYVVSLTGSVTDTALVEPGRELYVENCAACHGDAAEGGQDFGAPNLADAIWFYGSTEDAIAAQIKTPKHGVMPAWGERLGDVTVKQLAVYVHSLGGGE